MINQWLGCHPDILRVIGDFHGVALKNLRVEPCGITATTLTNLPYLYLLNPTGLIEIWYHDSSRVKTNKSWFYEGVDNHDQPP